MLDEGFARDALEKLYSAVHTQEIIHYFNESSQDIDHVLDVFVRTNNGGSKLNYSDLLMSITVAHWEGDFRKEIDDLINKIHSDKGFYLGRDWILKTCLMLTGVDVRFKVKNFKSDQVELIQKDWSEIKQCIEETFILVDRFGINPQSLTSKNAVIPICYYLYKKQFSRKPLYESINSLSKCHEDRKGISQWFYMALLKGIFGGQADSILSSMRSVFDDHMNDGAFPLAAIIERYKTTNKDLRFDEEYIESLLDIQHGEGRCRALLHLLFPEMDPTEKFDIDHLHAQSKFKRIELNKFEFLKADEKLLKFYNDSKHWNSIPNLHLLNASQNRSKSKRELADWIKDDGTYFKKESLLVEDVSLDFKEFRGFYIKRRDALKERLKKLVFMQSPIDTKLELVDSDEDSIE